MSNRLPNRPMIAHEMALATLKGRGFSRAIEIPKHLTALAAEGMKVITNEFPQGLKPRIPLAYLAARLKPRPFKAAIFSAAILAACLTLFATTNTFAQSHQPATPVVLDRVVAVVNNHAILASDIDEEIQLSVLDPAGVGQGTLTRQRALEQLISRALIQQQIREEDAQAAEPPQAEVDARLMEMRKELPICIRQNCASDAEWKAFLAAHGLTLERVESYLRYRLQILRFIEQRFQPGIRVSPEQIEDYYRDTLLPQYTAGETIPKLEQVAPRIEEILLQQQVNVLFDDWLGNLRKQGEIEVLDPALETTQPQTGAPAEAPALEGATVPATAPGQKKAKGRQ